MRTLYIDCGMGAAGDMLTAALLELIPDQDGFIAEFNSLGLPGIKMVKEPSIKCGIAGTHVSMLINGEEEGEEHHHHEPRPATGHGRCRPRRARPGRGQAGRHHLLAEEVPLPPL